MKKLVASLVLLLSVFSAFSQGRIDGVVKDSEGTPLIGAFVNLENTFLYNATDLDGQFSFENLNPGTYDLFITYLGFKDHLESVEIAGSEAVKVEVSM